MKMCKILVFCIKNVEKNQFLSFYILLYDKLNPPPKIFLLTIIQHNDELKHQVQIKHQVQKHKVW